MDNSTVVTMFDGQHPADGNFVVYDWKSGQGTIICREDIGGGLVRMRVHKVHMVASKGFEMNAMTKDQARRANETLEMQIDALKSEIAADKGSE